MNYGYSYNDTKELFKPFKLILKYVDIVNITGRAKDMARKRRIPIDDAVHALVARREKAILVTRDNHFKLLQDVIKTHKPEEII